MVNDVKSEKLQIRVSELEKNVIQAKADLLNITVADYVRECCIFSNATKMFIMKLHGCSESEEAQQS